jgi:uncharacterized protein (DUF849 family)/GNAT superfamily N-acetyltransferase
MLLKAAINGGRSPAEHPRLPILPEEMAAAAAAALRAGADAVHLHVRSIDGRESLAAEDVAVTLSAVRGACGGAPVGISTGAWILPDPAARLAAVGGWTSRPDFASVNFSEPGAGALARALLELGVDVEAGLDSAEAARRLVGSGLGPACLRLLLEPQEPEPGRALGVVAELERVLDDARLEVSRLLHGCGPTAWPLLRAAGRRGYDARTGLEDTLELPDGRTARDNAELVETAFDLLQSGAGLPRVDLRALDEPTLMALIADADAYAAQARLVLEPHTALLEEVARQTLAFMRRSGSSGPWAGYLATDPDQRLVVGTCAFKGPPDAEGMVELAYYTFPGWEGRGYATAMARALRDRAAASGAVRLVRAHTLRERNASARLLSKLGFGFVGEVTEPDDGLVWRWDWPVPALVAEVH